MRRLLTACLLGTLLVTLLGVTGGVYLLVGRHLQRTGLERLRLAVFGDARPGLERLNEAPDLDRIANRQVFVRYGGRQAGGPPEPPRLPAAADRPRHYFSRNPHERFLTLEVPAPGGTLQVAAAYGPSDDLLRALGGYLLLCAGAGFGLAALASGWAARRLARPLEELAEAARVVAGGDLDRRVGVLAGPHELASLALDFDRMVARLQAALLEQRRFVADASHELKTPLASILALGELLEQPDQGHHARSLEVLNREAGRMRELVEDLLLLSRLEATEPAPEPLELAEPLRELVNDYRLRHPNLQLEAISWRARIGPDKWLRIVRNLLENALRHTPPEREVRVRLSPGALEIEDEGSGIPPEALPLVFERFFRVDPARARQSGGTGLGLAIVRAAVERAGGRVNLANRAAGGVLARVELPVA